jgi:Leucine-rich repeat (LRR) protein
VSITPLQGSGFKQRDRSSERERTHEENLTARRTHSAGIRDKASRDHSPHLPGLHVSMSVAYGGCTRRCLLLGDRVVFGDSPSAPGVPLVYRLPEDRQANPDRLNLDRRRLNVCPLLEGEDQLRLLNLQHNMIPQIQHLGALRRLIFLDLYDNMITEMSGLQSLSSLRVLMLGKNRWYTSS